MPGPGPQPAGAISTLTRSQILDRLEAEVFDCVVVGGGITGAGIAREAATRGLAVALLEREDFAAGTSSRSTQLIHGGLRYIAMGDLGLVRRTARERQVLHAMAPHLARRRWMVVPARSRMELLKLRAGIAAYERLGGVKKADRHFQWNVSDLEREEPLLDRSRWPCACVYGEYLTHDSRLVVANLRAAVERGATVLNYLSADAFLDEERGASGVEAHCRFSGRRLRVRGRCVINASGPWVDSVRRLEDPAAVGFLHLSKGVHIGLAASRLAVRNLLMLKAEDGRSVFVIPRGAVVYTGTTDTTYESGHQVWPEITRQDVEYLLKALDRCLTLEEPFGPQDVVTAWAGLRPLVAQPGKAPAEMSRREEIKVGTRGVVTIAGGKLTGYRLMAHSALETGARLRRLTLAPQPAEERPLPGGDFDGHVDTLATLVEQDCRVSRACAQRLVGLYGTEARQVLGMGLESLVPAGPVVAGEVDWGVRVEGAATLVDLLYRRTRVAVYDPELAPAVVEPAANRMGRLLGWTPQRQRDEIEGVRARLDGDLSFSSTGLR